jgi:large subunit ribosomal protein L32
MAHPKRRHSNTRTRLRRSHHALKVKSRSKCTNCGAAILPHRGYYRSRQVLTIKSKEEKKGK